MIQICRKDKEKVYEAIRTGKADAAEMSFPDLIDGQNARQTLTFLPGRT